MPNENCLEGFKCPACRQDEVFHIAVHTMAIVTDDGISDSGDMEWDDESFCACPECGRTGQVCDFQRRVR